MCCENYGLPGLLLSRPLEASQQNMDGPIALWNSSIKVVLLLMEGRLAGGGAAILDQLPATSLLLAVTNLNSSSVCT